METYNLSIVIGLCKELHKGILINSDESGLITNFTSFLTPPHRDEYYECENQNVLRLALEGKLEASDVSLLTNMDVSIPMKVDKLQHHVKNCSGVIGRVIGKDCILFLKLTKLWKHIDAKDTRYNY